MELRLPPLRRRPHPGRRRAPAGNQSSICVSADGERWVLFNASPDVRTQLAATPALWPRIAPPQPRARGGAHQRGHRPRRGLLVLREGGAPAIYCTARVEEALTEGLRMLPALAAYGPVCVRRVVCGEAQAVCDREGEPTGVTVRAFAVTSKPPPYMTGRAPVEGAVDTVGYVISAAGRRVDRVRAGRAGARRGAPA
jgi:pyrroloquinoline quinone biosynthesis protein B